jgi:hypothetical protein
MEKGHLEEEFSIVDATELANGNSPEAEERIKRGRRGGWLAVAVF